MKAIQISSPGSPDVMHEVDVDPPAATPGHVVVKVDVAGVNFIDTYQRAGRYPMELPVTLGLEGVGEVVALGEGVDHLAAGDVVAWAWAQGSYAEFALVSQDKAVLVPEGLAVDDAASVMMQGITAHYLTTSVYDAQPGDIALVHAAAGGAGLLLCQMLSARGVEIVGTVSSEAKANAALAAGASHIIRYDRVDFVDEVTAITAGKKCDVVYDGVGASTFEGSLQCLVARGTLALYGAASGPVPPFDLQRLSGLGSLIVTRPTIAHFLRTREENQWRASEVFKAVRAGNLQITIDRHYKLTEAADAHRDIESRKTIGKLLLTV